MAGVLVLGEAEVREALHLSEAIPAVEAAFASLAGGQAVMPAKLYLTFPRHNGDLRVMPSSIGEELCGVKIVNSHPGNPARGLPAVIGTYMLVSQETGEPLAVMGGTYLTAVRTAAASAVATSRLARLEAKVLGLVGAGVQAGFHLDAMSIVRPLERVLVWAPPADSGRRDKAVEAMSASHPGLQIHAVDDPAEAGGAHIICTTTPSRAPVLMDAWVKPGAHINAVGADGPGKQELEPSLLRRATVVVDDWEQARHGGEINVALSSGEISESDIAGSLGDLISGKTAGRSSADEVTIFDSTGLAIEDLAVASLVYRAALERGLGHREDLWS